MRKKILRFIPLIIVMAIIFFFSSMPKEESSKTSGKLLEQIVDVIEKISRHSVKLNTKKVMHNVLRKLAHFSEYGVMELTALYAFWPYMKRRWVILVSLLGCFVYACTDEFHQKFVSGRYMTFSDVMIDTSGALVFMLVAFGIMKLIEIRKKKAK